MKLEIIAFVLIWVIKGVVALENETLALYKGDENVHSRRKRYIVFPKGASLQILLEALAHVPTQFPVFIGPTSQISWPLPSDPNELRSKRSLSGSSFSFRKTSTLFGRKSDMFHDIARLLDLISDYYSEPLVYCNTYLFRPVVDIFRFGMTVGLAWQLPDDPMIYSEFKKKHKIYKRNALKKMEAFLRPGGADGRQCVLKALCESGQRTPSKKGFLPELLHKIFSMDAEDELEDSHEDKMYRKAHQSVNQNCETLYPDCSFSVFNAIK